MNKNKSVLPPYIDDILPRGNRPHSVSCCGGVRGMLLASCIAAAITHPAAAREITALTVDSATHVATVAFTAGEAGDGHVLYYVWSDDAQDKGASLAAWPNVLRVTRVADDATSHSFELPDVAAGGDRFAARAFLATSDRDYDNFVQGVAGGTAGNSAVYFETGINPGPTTSIRLDAKFNVTTAQQYLFGISPQNGKSFDTVLAFAAYSNGSKQFASALQDSAGDWQTTSVATDTQRNIFSLDAASGVFSVVRASDGTAVASSTHETTRTITSRSDFTIVLFGRRTPSSATKSAVGGHGANATIYACSITNNGACVRDYVPAVKNGVAGLYDKVNNTFAGSAGGTPLTQSGGVVTTYGIDAGDTAVAASPVEIHLGELAIPYDAETTNATPVAVASTFAVPAGYVQSLALSSAITLPFHETLRLEVLTVATGAADLSADDFVDNTEKTYGLPNTTIEVEKDGDGVQHVYLVAKPVVKSVAEFPTADNAMTLNGNASLWSDGNAVHTGADYLIVHSVAQMGNADFRGDSLTVCNDHINTRTVNCKITKATVYAPTTIIQNWDTRDITVSGDMRIAGSFDDTSYVTFNEKYSNGHYHRLSATLTGEGPLKITSNAAGGLIYAQIYGNNSAYKGRIYVTKNGSVLGEYLGTQLWFNSTNALGGALDTFKYNALTLDKCSLLYPTTTMTLQTENRGIYGSGSFGFKVPDGVTLTVKEPIRAAYNIYKHGTGTLVLGGAISYGADGTGTSMEDGKVFYVREGAVAALDDAAVAGLNAVFSNATTIVVSPDAGLVNGFTGTLSVLEDIETGEPGKVTVALADDFAPSGGRQPFSAVIATVPDTNGDLSSSFSVAAVRGFAALVTTESATVGGVDCTRYSAKYVPTGMIIVFR